MKLFIATDIHGHASIMKRTLEKAGFVIGAKDHLLICCGDYFDRGHENLDVLKFLESIPNKLLIEGNHEQMLADMMQTGKVYSVAGGNGTILTINEFFGEDAIAPDGTLRMAPHKKRRIRKFLNDTVDYFETEHFIFVHGWIPLAIEDGYYVRKPYWRRSPVGDFANSRWLKWNELYGYFHLAPEEKTLICGHRSAEYGIYFDSKRPEGSSLPFFGKGLIALDAATVASGRINLLVIEDDLLTQTHCMSLRAEHFEAIRAGKKTVELRLLDEKREKLHIGDIIEFTCTESGETLTVEVRGLYSYHSFEELVKDFRPAELGFAGKTRKHICTYMNSLYPTESRGDTRALAIKIRKF